VNECSYETGQIVIHLKGLNQRLCRKGLLERGISVGKWFGNFKSLENELMKKAAVQNGNVEELLLELQKQKSKIVYDELNRLKRELRFLNKSITRIKQNVLIKAGGGIYCKWMYYINEFSADFVKMYSNEANDLFNHLYRMDTIFERTIRKTAINVSSINDKIWVPFQIEKDLKGLLPKELCDDMTKNSSNGSVDNGPNIIDGSNTSGVNASSLNSNDDSGVGLNSSLFLNQNKFDNGSVKREDSSLKNKKRKVSMDDFDTVDAVGEVDLSDFNDFIKRHSYSKRKVNRE